MTDAMGVALFPFLLLRADLPFRFPEEDVIEMLHYALLLC